MLCSNVKPNPFSDHKSVFSSVGGSKTFIFHVFALLFVLLWTFWIFSGRWQMRWENLLELLLMMMMVKIIWIGKAFSFRIQLIYHFKLIYQFIFHIKTCEIILNLWNFLIIHYKNPLLHLKICMLKNFSIFNTIKLIRTRPSNSRLLLYEFYLIS